MGQAVAGRAGSAWQLCVGTSFCHGPSRPGAGSHCWLGPKQLEVHKFMLDPPQITELRAPLSLVFALHQVLPLLRVGQFLGSCKVLEVASALSE